MERFPTEIMVQIANCLSKSDLSQFGTCSSKCAVIAQPLLYHTITLLDINDSSDRCSRFLRNVTSRPHLPPMVRVLCVVGHHKWPELPLAALLRYCDHIEELLLQGISVTRAHTGVTAPAILRYSPARLSAVSANSIVESTQRFPISYNGSPASLLSPMFVFRNLATSISRTSWRTRFCHRPG